ncbi:hypothetical protein [Streptomyces sioyaensis]|uniref:hypothetical protein n=1 Tax=Streptomyces sioyaensis TaxID=67364 RepID=UPI00378808A5
MLGIDVLRALPILGMVWLHFALTGWGNPAPTGKPADSTLTWIDGLLGTRSGEIFFLPAGVTVALLTGGTSIRHGRERVIAWKRVAVRAGMLFVLARVVTAGIRRGSPWTSTPAVLPAAGTTVLER